MEHSALDGETTILDKISEAVDLGLSNKLDNDLDRVMKMFYLHMQMNDKIRTSKNDYFF
jgi:hypothetical protein